MPLYVHSSSTCDVCLRNYAADLQPYGIPCGHIFCKDCLARILSTREEQRTINLSTIPARGECPLCRRNYRDLESAKRLRVDILDAIRVSPNKEDQATLERELKEREDDALVRRWLQVHPDDSVTLEELEQRMETREDLVRSIFA
ncbi:hypothetical protein CYLTODRAFT_69834 [Cylindrobasidium torrendii FP15055 ss-10]|uniref:RING-type domain-containing protein n=1 Tax=Cylindrobasidium torrendii FP15055 ss-10 TaxID=1314674 RepID=A0A0D7BPB9_9AGAR|nr:hypothetical protein CYLTODRAFT_69834 [Cylindrobasidium torrendii FP15055 ss-10]